MTADDRAPVHHTVDIALEARVRRWTVEEREGHVQLVQPSSDSSDEPATSGGDVLSVTSGGVLRVAVLAGPQPEIEQVLRRVVLASGALLVQMLRSNDPRSFVERATALRDVEALRMGCADRSPAPRVVVAGEPHSTLRLKAAAAGLAVEILPDPRRKDGIAAFAHRARDFRRGTAGSVVLRDEALEELARLVAAHGTDALVVDVSGGSTSLVRASADGSVIAAHVASLGFGVAADHTVGRAGLDAVRRWIPWAIDGPTLLERVFNRARWPDAVAADASALALEIALAHEALSHALADAGAAGIAAPLRDAPLTIVTGAAASFSRAAHTALVAIDGLASPRPTTLHRDVDDALVALGAIAARIRAAGGDPAATVSDELARRLAPIAFVVPVTPSGKRGKLIVGGREQDEEPLVAGAFFSVRHRGEVMVELSGTSLKAKGAAGELGVIIDARGRPLVLPPRDAERIPTLVRWFAALDLAAGGVA